MICPVEIAREMSAFAGGESEETMVSMEFYSKAAMEQVMKIQTTERPTPNLPWTLKSPNPLPYPIVGVMTRVQGCIGVWPAAQAPA